MPEKPNIFANGQRGLGAWKTPAPSLTASVPKPIAPAVPAPAAEQPSAVVDAAPAPFMEAHRESPPPGRFALVTRKGQYWSYPYAYAGLIECGTPAELVIHCNCGAVERIVIKGRGLDRIATGLSAQRLISITESDRRAFVGETVVLEILVQQAKGRNG